ncbi:MAG: polysaccharide deacetylase family protein [Nitrospira sp.]|nr:polysaccharide deacetylase family protein [Nitrospira sp.]
MTTPRQKLPSPRSFREDRIAWVIFFIITCLSVGGSYLWFHRQVVRLPDPVRVQSDNPRITVLAYDRIVDQKDGEHVDRALIRDHLQALRLKGFEPITLSELMNFYKSGRPLPPKALLLTFDYGYLETYVVIDPILREMEWRGVLFILTSRQQRRDPMFLYWDRLQRMVDSGVWEIGSNGHMSRDPIPVNIDGHEGLFIADRMWLSELQRHETLEEFGQRILNDYRVSRESIEGHLKRYKLVAYAIPSGGLSQIHDRELYQMNQKSLETFYSLCFVNDRFGVNDRLSSLHCLKRLLVRAEWSGKDLVERLDSALKDPPLEGQASGEHTRWVIGEGKTYLEKDEIVLEGSPRADLWLSGSQWVEDWVLEADVWVESGELWAVQESPALQGLWRWGGTPEGLALQYRETAEAIQTLRHFPEGIKPRAWWHLRLIKRGSGLWIEIDGQPIMNRPAYLPVKWRGPVGWVVWRADGKASARLSHLKFFRFPYRVGLVSSRPTQEEVQSLIQGAPDLSALSPLGLVVNKDEVQEVPIDRELFSILSRRYGWDILPRVRVREAAEVVQTSDGKSGPVLSSEFWESWLLDRTEKEGWDGVYMDSSFLTGQNIEKWSPVLKRMEQSFRHKNRRFVLSDNEKLAFPLSMNAYVVQ